MTIFEWITIANQIGILALCYIVGRHDASIKIIMEQLNKGE